MAFFGGSNFAGGLFVFAIGLLLLSIFSFLVAKWPVSRPMALRLNMSNSLPHFISLEGGEAWANRRRSSGSPSACASSATKSLVTREPGGTPLGESIRHLLKHAPEGRGMTPYTELLLFLASRAELVRKVIMPALDQGTLGALRPLSRLDHGLSGRGPAAADGNRRARQCLRGRRPSAQPHARARPRARGRAPAPDRAARIRPAAARSTAWKPSRSISSSACARATSKSPRPIRTASKSSPPPAPSTRPPRRSGRKWRKTFTYNVAAVYDRRYFHGVADFAISAENDTWMLW